METTIITCPHCGKHNRVPAAAVGKPRCGNCHNWLPWIAAAGDRDFADVVEKSPIPVLVDLWATWCGPCRMVSPALEQLATERAGSLKLVKVDVDSAPAISRRFDVRGTHLAACRSRSDIGAPGRCGTPGRGSELARPGAVDQHS